MPVEYPVILSHNVNRPGSEHLSWTSTASGFDSDRTYDGLRYTTWKATSAGNQNLNIRTPNLLSDSGFEDGVSAWELETTGTATATLARTEDQALEGDASAEVDVTVYSSGDVLLKHRKTFNLKANKTYHLSGTARNDNAASDTVILRIVDSSGSSLASANITGVDNVEWEGNHVEYTPTADQDDVTVRLEMPQAVRTNYIDAVWFNEVRAVDTLIIDQGHTLKGTDVAVRYRTNASETSWSTAYSSTEVTTSRVLYISFTGVSAMDWRINLQNAEKTAEIPSIHLGKRVTLSHNPVGFDPNAEDGMSRETTTEAGIVRDYFQYRVRRVSAQFENIGPTTEFSEWEDWWADIDGGREHFWWIWRPTSRPTERLLLRLSDKSFSFPFDRFSRAGGFNAEEVRGQLEPA